MLSRFRCVRFCATLWTAAHQAPLSTGFSRQEYWSGLPFPSPRLLFRLRFMGVHFTQNKSHLLVYMCECVFQKSFLFTFDQSKSVIGFIVSNFLRTHGL